MDFWVLGVIFWVLITAGLLASSFMLSVDLEKKQDDGPWEEYVALFVVSGTAGGWIVLPWLDAWW